MYIDNLVSKLFFLGLKLTDFELSERFKPTFAKFCFWMVSLDLALKRSSIFCKVSSALSFNVCEKILMILKVVLVDKCLVSNHQECLSNEIDVSEQ